jgi:hypothetical protein
VATKLTSDQLAGTPLKGKDDVFVGSLNKWILFYGGMTLPQGDLRKDECADLMETLGVGYQIWLGWNVRMQWSSFNKGILTLVDDITSVGNGAIYIQPKNSTRHISSNGVTCTLEYASAKDYPSIATSLKE